MINNILNQKILSPDDFNIQTRLDEHPTIKDDIFHKCEKQVVDLCIDKFKDLLEAHVPSTLDENLTSIQGHLELRCELASQVGRVPQDLGWPY